MFFRNLLRRYSAPLLNRLLPYRTVTIHLSPVYKELFTYSKIVCRARFPRLFVRRAKLFGLWYRTPNGQMSWYPRNAFVIIVVSAHT